MKKIIEKINIDKCLMLVSIIAFCILTIPKLLNHVPWYDETNSWVLAKNMNIYNFAEILRSEGHFIIWYLIVMPFAKLNLWFPYSLKFLNWGILFITLLFMWKKAPFNSIIKTIITLSYIVLNYYAIVARCYNIGILGLFLLAYFYDKKTTRPILYSILLVLTAHTSVLAAFAVVPLGLIFLYEMADKWKNNQKAEVITSVAILFLGAVLLVFPFLHGYGSAGFLASNPPRLTFIYIYFKAYKFILGFSYILCCLLVLFFADNKIRFFITAAIAEFMIFFSLIYGAYPHHVIFLFIYLIVAFWLTPKLHQWNIRSWVFLISFAILANLNLDNSFSYILINPNKQVLINYINKQNVKFVIMPWNYSDIIPQLPDNISIKSVFSGDIKDYNKDTIKDYYYKLLLQNEDSDEAIVMTCDKIYDDSVEFSFNQSENYKKIYAAKIKK